MLYLPILFFPAWHKGRLFGEARSNSEGKRQICFYSVEQMKLKLFFSRTGNKDGSRSTDTNWNTSKTKWWVYSLRAVVCTQNLRKALRNPSGNTESTSWSPVLSSLIFNIVPCPLLTDPKIIGQLFFKKCGCLYISESNTSSCVHCEQFNDNQGALTFDFLTSSQLY